MSEFRIIKAVDRWNATADRTIDDQDQVTIEVKDGDRTTTRTMTVAEFRNDTSLSGTSDERTKALEGAEWYSLNDGAALKEFSLKNRINTSTSSLPIVNSSTRFTEAILAKGREAVTAVVEFVEGIATAVVNEADKPNDDAPVDDDTEVNDNEDVDGDTVECDPDVDADCEVDENAAVDEDEEDCEVVDDEEEDDGVIKGAEDPMVPADGDPQVA